MMMQNRGRRENGGNQRAAFGESKFFTALDAQIPQI
jgi:hypothetical protein